MRKAFISPSKYVQGENELLCLGFFISTFGDSAFLIADKEDIDRVRKQLDETARKFKISFFESDFKGKITREEVDRLKKVAEKENCACTVGLGGGKAIDTAKCVADGKNVIIVPTIAASDAATSHSAVLYTKDGAFDDYAYFDHSPSVVLLDTAVIAKAPVRFLVAGMGDALATYFEARATAQSFSHVNAGLPCGAREGDCPPAVGTKAGLALAELAFDTLLEDGVKAKEACENGVVTQAFENIVEANILLSGLGFESAGLAAAHAIHDGLMELEEAREYQHGEVVTFGTLAQLIMENAPLEELTAVLDFCLEIGLPVCLEDIGLKDVDEEKLRKVAEKACDPEESVHNMPFPVSEEDVVAAIVTADQIGRNYKGQTE